MTLAERIAWAKKYAGYHVRAVKGHYKGIDGRVGGYNVSDGRIIVSETRYGYALSPHPEYVAVYDGATGGNYHYLEDLMLLGVTMLPNTKVTQGLEALERAEKRARGA